MPDPLRLVFLGSDAIALPLLDWLAGEGAALHARLVGVFTGPDRPAGRGQEVRPNAVKAWAAGRGLPIHQPEKPDASACESLAALNPDLSLVLAYGYLLKDEFIATPRLGTLNLHASLLPAYRGASPIQASVAAGDRETGMTLMRIVRELDAGPVADAERVAIAPLDTAREVESALAAASIRLLARTLPRLVRGELTFREQDSARASYCRRLEKADGVLDFGAPAPLLAARINGLFPWPAVSVDIAGHPVKCALAEALASDVSTPPGTVLGADPQGLLIATGSGTLRLLRLQRPGGRLLPAADFLRGFPIPAGTLLCSSPMPPLTASAPFKIS